MRSLIVLVDPTLPASQLAGALAVAGLTLRRDARMRHLVIGVTHTPHQCTELRRLVNALAVAAQEAHHKSS